ncbi:MAG TPA: type II secretion system protein [Patescibacteria group bacterium]
MQKFRLPRIFKILIPKTKDERGFTLVELILVMGIVAILLGFVTINLIKAQNSSSISSTLNTVISDIKNQQIKAMVGDAQGGAAESSYGVHFDTSKYVLFKGSTYNSSDTSNFVVNLTPDLIFTNINLPSGNIIFSVQSGEVSGFVIGQNTVDIESTNSSKTYTITINQYGVITSAQ